MTLPDIQTHPYASPFDRAVQATVDGLRYWFQHVDPGARVTGGRSLSSAYVHTDDWDKARWAVASVALQAAGYTEVWRSTTVEARDAAASCADEDADLPFWAVVCAAEAALGLTDAHKVRAHFIRVPGLLRVA